MPSSRDKFAGLAATAGVVTVLIVGFVNLGGPRTQRLIQADNQRIQNLSTLALEIKTKWTNSNYVLPATLDDVASSNQIRYDPVARLTNTTPATRVSTNCARISPATTVLQGGVYFGRTPPDTTAFRWMLRVRQSRSTGIRPSTGGQITKKPPRAARAFL